MILVRPSPADTLLHRKRAGLEATVSAGDIKVFGKDCEQRCFLASKEGIAVARLLLVK